MDTTYNIYCDESCQLEHDRIPIMLLGSVWCPLDKAKSIAKEIREIKAKHNAKGKLKWTKISNSRLKFYQHLLDYFFRKDGFNFRCLVVVGKEGLNPSHFQSPQKSCTSVSSDPHSGHLTRPIKTFEPSGFSLTLCSFTQCRKVHLQVRHKA
jgi:hypothetical protein